MTQYLFRNVELLDPAQDRLLGGHEVLVEDELVRDVSDRPITAAGATVIDGGGRTLMPGLIDCHVHVYLSEVNIRNLEHVPLTLMTARAAPLMRGMIDRGFTTVRDTGGADWGIKAAVEGGLLPGPRLFISGRAIGPTGGHSDSRRRTEAEPPPCRCCNAMAFTMSLADGADELKLHGQYVKVRAKVHRLDSLSAHADYAEIISWLRQSPIAPARTFVTHGEPAAADALRRRLRDELGWEAVVPDHASRWALAAR